MAVRLFLRELVLDAHTDEVVDTADVWLADSVDATHVASVIEQRYGPLDEVVWTATEEFERIELGWTYPVPDERRIEGRDLDLLVVPMLLDEGSRREVPLMIHLAEQELLMESLRERGVDVTVVRAPAQEWVGEDEGEGEGA